MQPTGVINQVFKPSLVPIRKCNETATTLACSFLWFNYLDRCEICREYVLDNQCAFHAFAPLVFQIFFAPRFKYSCL